MLVLRTFNLRKNDIKSMSIDQFIKEHYPKAYNRFYVKMLKTKVKKLKIVDIIQALHPNIDVSELVNLGTSDDYIGPYSRVFTEILRLYNYPVHF